MNSVLAVIPARGGSKGIPGKNLKVINGLSLTARAVLTAFKTPGISRVIVSTDSEDVAKEARFYGAEVPFIRPEHLSTDAANSVQMWQHAWKESEMFFGQEFNISVLLEPTSPHRTPEDIVRTLEAINADGEIAAATVSRTPAHYTPEKTLTIQDGHISFYLDKGKQHSLRQSIPPYYHRNGICYAVTKEPLYSHDAIIDWKCRPIIIDRHVVNIDTHEDLEYAEFLIKKSGDFLDDTNHG